MKQMTRHIFLITLCAITMLKLFPLSTFAWGDNGGGRPEYTKEEINNGAIGATEISDGENYKESGNYPGKIVFNSISDSTIGHEFNFVAARELAFNPDGTIIGATKETIWNANEIEVSDGQTYIIRAFIHNNNPNGEDAVAEDTKVEFIVPTDSAKEIEVNGIISSSNATPSRYWDHVTFKSSNLFHLEYIENTAWLENNGIGRGGIQLSNDILKSGGTLIGYDKLDGRIPGCYQYANYVTIQVKAVFDDFMVETKVRHAGDKEWQDTIDAEVGDKVEFQIEYWNTSDEWQNDVVIRDILPPNLCYVPGSTKIKNSSYPEGADINEDFIADDNGISVGDYGPNANVFIMFTAEVIDDNLALGKNSLINKGQAYANSKLLEDRAIVVTDKIDKHISISSIIVLAVAIVLITSIYLIIIKFNRRK